MKAHYVKEGEATRTETSIDLVRIIVEDSAGNQYRITQDKFGGIDILAEDGHIIIEPHVANHITIKTQQ